MNCASQCAEHTALSGLPGTGLMLAHAWARRTSVTRKFMISAFISSFLSRTLLIFFSHSCLLTDLCRRQHLL